MSLLLLQNVHKTFERGSVNENHVLRGVVLDVAEGDFISIIGGNGAGKSTLLNAIAGSLTIDEGDILLDGASIKKQSVEQRAKRIARVFQDTRMGTASNLTIEENMAVAHRRGQKRGLRASVTAQDRELFKQVLSTLDLGLENRLKTMTQFLSGGQRQALTLAMATLIRPDVLLLDEHTAALDPKTSEMVMALTKKIVEQHHLTTLMITHNMEHAIAYGNRLVMLYQGKIVVDVSGEEKANLTVPQLLDLFKSNSGEMFSEDSVILG
ncbi:ABC transporter ATP-binding protein [Carnobacteriaceae bacterium zg-ZUI252]|nr:ABC transporter ATP-binding protein [Carnobacteriaceae bacterium zg-ZUI252]MBS4769576.1 ABC transporter ATP-binding protein [Carnobacteriaceae bacterium zg-ZUI240]QTU83041.1 ABC transporter ATP-binding protein [Carnobacteriaceae bacterium zg-C25]